MSKTRQYCFTINNPCKEEEDVLISLEDQVEYIVWGRETGESGTPHFQGYVVFKNPRTISGLKKLLPRAHIEIAKGTPAQNEIYCKKDQDWTEYSAVCKWDFSGSSHNPIVIE